MPKVPERKLSYGELLENLRRIDKSRQNQNAVKKFKQPKKSKKYKGSVAPEYNYYQVINKLKQL